MRVGYAHLIGLIAAAALLIGAPLCAFSAGSELTADSVKIGYVDFNRAINEVSDGVTAKKRLKDEFREKQQRLDILQAELTAMKDDLDRDRMLLSAEAIEAKEKQYRDKFVEVQQRYADFRRQIADRETHLTEGILQRLRDIVRGFGDSEGYALILEKSQEVVLYAPSGRDLTNRVISEYNRGGGSKKGK
ncbi:MAG: OmpH family outer membrane protein [bacterium]